MLKRIFAGTGNALPLAWRAALAQHLAYAGMREDASEWLGRGVFEGLALGLAAEIATVVAGFTSFTALASAAATLLLFLAVRYLLLYFKIEDRRARVEAALPDLLQMISANLKAGVTPVVALRMAARPEFGPLEEEIKYVATKSLGTESFAAAFQEITKSIKSEVLARTVALFIMSMRSGGNLARLLEVSAEDIRAAQELKRSLVAGTNMYVVFILFTTVIGMPALLAVSMQFVELTARLQAKAAAGAGLAGQIGVILAKPIAPEFILNLSLATLVATSLLASVFIGVIHEGKRLYGLRIAPFLIAGSLAFLFIMKNYVLKLVLGG
ncbi:MAG: type II secretion system F family protein [Candidatus Micrarchaeia archaeon]